MGIVIRLACLVVITVLTPYFFKVKATAFDYAEGEQAQSDEKIFERPLREVSIILTAEGYYPERVVAFQGERVKFFITSTVAAPGCLILSGHNLFLSAQKGRVSQGEVTLKNSGDFTFYCPSSKHKGNFVVLDGASAGQRGPASIGSKHTWMPRKQKDQQ